MFAATLEDCRKYQNSKIVIVLALCLWENSVLDWVSCFVPRAGLYGYNVRSVTFYCCCYVHIELSLVILRNRGCCFTSFVVKLIISKVAFFCMMKLS